MKHASSNHNEYVDLSLGTRYSDVYLLCKYLIEVSKRRANQQFINTGDDCSV